VSARRPTWALLREDELLYGRFILTLPGWHVDETVDERAARRRADTRWEEFILELVELGPVAALASWHESRRTT